MDFAFFNPTRLIFGAGHLSKLGELACQYGKKNALIVTGGGSVKRSGVFDRAAALPMSVPCMKGSPTPSN